MSQGSPYPRRKSCNACIKAKRRCDLSTPQCTRCLQKSIECVYNGQLPQHKHYSPNGSSSTVNALQISRLSVTTTADPSIQPAPALLHLPEFNFDAMSFELPEDFNPGLAFLEFVPSLPLPPFPDDYPTPDTLLTNNTSTRTYSHEDYDHIEDIIDEYRVEQLNDDTTRVACAVAAIRAWHYSMAFSFSTPFLHRQLYAGERPQFITSVFASCLMYATKTKHTEDIVRPIIENYACALIIENSGSDMTPSTALARAQALLLYQSMRTAQYVERDLPILEKWIEYLADLRDRSGVNLTSEAPTSPENWDSWVFWESVSRTILAASYFINVHCLIARGEHPLGEWTRPNMWTASKSLWSAENSADFYERWQKRKPVMVCNIFIDNLLKEGYGNDVDAFASMLMVPTLGLEGTKKWVSDSSGRVEELASDTC